MLGSHAVSLGGDLGDGVTAEFFRAVIWRLVRPKFDGHSPRQFERFQAGDAEAGGEGVIVKQGCQRQDDSGTDDKAIQRAFMDDGPSKHRLRRRTSDDRQPLQPQGEQQQLLDDFTPVAGLMSLNKPIA